MTAPSTERRVAVRKPHAGVTVDWHRSADAWVGYVNGEWIGAVYESGGQYLAEHRLTKRGGGDEIVSRHSTPKGARQAITLRLSRFVAAFGM